MERSVRSSSTVGAHVFANDAGVGLDHEDETSTRLNIVALRRGDQGWATKGRWVTRLSKAAKSTPICGILAKTWDEPWAVAVQVPLGSLLHTPAMVRFVVGMFRSKAALVAENELLRVQLVAAKCRLEGKRVRLDRWERLKIAWLTRATDAWRSAVAVVQPATVLRWHRASFRLFWRWRSRRGRRPTVRAAIIREMAATANPRWGAERIPGELLKLGVRVSKRTIQGTCGSRCRAATASDGRRSSARQWGVSSLPWALASRSDNDRDRPLF